MTKIITTAALALGSPRSRGARGPPRIQEAPPLPRTSPKRTRGPPFSRAIRTAGALPGNSSNTATSNTTLPSNDPAANPAPKSKKTKKRQPAQGRSGAGDMHRAKTTPSDTPPADETKTSPASPAAPKASDEKTTSPGSATDTRSGASSSPSDQGTPGSVARPPAPSTTDDKGASKDPGMSSRPGDVTGQPTDTQKPVDTAPSGSQPKDR